jgi:hypothetical protein
VEFWSESEVAALQFFANELLAINVDSTKPSAKPLDVRYFAFGILNFHAADPVSRTCSRQHVSRVGA